MAAGLHTFVGGAKRVKKVVTFTVGSNTNGEVFAITARHPSGSDATEIVIATDTASSDTTTSIATELAAQWNASRHVWAYGGDAMSWIGGAVATSNGAVVTLTARRAGWDFIANVGATTTGTLTKATSTANSGPEDLSVAGNWSRGEVLDEPADDVEITGPYSIKFGLDLDGVAADTIHVRNWTGAELGWPQQFLLIDPDEFIYDCPRGGKAWIHVGTTAAPVTIWNGGKELHLIGGNASAIWEVHGGGVSIAESEGAAAHVGTMATLINYGANLWIGRACTATNYRQDAGSCRDEQEAARTLTYLDSGYYMEEIDGTITTFTNNGAMAIMRGTSTVTTANCHAGISDFSKTQRARTISTLNYVPEATLISGLHTVTTRNPLGKSAIGKGGGGSGDGI